MIELSEYDKITLPDNFEKGDLLHLHEFHEKNIQIGVSDQKYFIKAKSKVGTIKLPSGEIIQIKPKVGVNCLMYMIAYSHNISNLQFRYLTNHTTIEDDSPLDLYVRVLVFWVELLLKRGLLKSYQTHRDSISGVKGKMLPSILNHKKDKRWCEFDELSYSNPANELIKATFVYIQKLSPDKQLNSEVKRIIMQMKMIADIKPTSKSFNKKNFTGLNQHYNSMIDLCDLIFHNSRLNDIDGNRYFSGFMIDMNKIFEKFLLNTLRKRLSTEKVKATYKDGWAIKLNGDDYLPRLIPDIIIENKLVIDAKYYSNPLTENNKFISGNLYQLKTYMNVFNVNGVLIYPKSITSLESIYEINGKKFAIMTLALDNDSKKMDIELNKLVSQLIKLFK